jgi:hypothetical protein
MTTDFRISGNSVGRLTRLTGEGTKASRDLDLDLQMTQMRLIDESELLLVIPAASFSDAPN